MLVHGIKGGDWKDSVCAVALFGGNFCPKFVLAKLICKILTIMAAVCLELCPSTTRKQFIMLAMRRIVQHSQ